MDILTGREKTAPFSEMVTLLETCLVRRETFSQGRAQDQGGGEGAPGLGRDPTADHSLIFDFPLRDSATKMTEKEPKIATNSQVNKSYQMFK